MPEDTNATQTSSQDNPAQGSLTQTATMQDATQAAAQVAAQATEQATDEQEAMMGPTIDQEVQPTDVPETTGAAEVEDIVPEVVKKIAESMNILIALSSDPSVDEMAAAIGLSIYLDRIDKKVTAIYSGATPNALEFLKPEETFEESVDVLRDFVIALNKEKADHLRYKLDGDFVRIFITPYKDKILEDDLEFSYGDYNIDLVLALDVANGIDLDAALREHGRIMHDATIINITTGKPGKFGEIEWSDKMASSVSEMIAGLLYAASGDVPMEKEEATAFLTGIVAATSRFSNAKTTPKTMTIASQLMSSGANQQVVSQNITPDVDNELFLMNAVSRKSDTESTDPTQLEISHDENAPEDQNTEINATVTEKPSTLLDELKEAEASLAGAGAETVQEQKDKPLVINETVGTTVQPPADMAVPEPEAPVEAHIGEPEPVTLPTPEAPVEVAETPTVTPETPAVAPELPNMTPEMSSVPEMNFAPEAEDDLLPPPPPPPAFMGQPPVDGQLAMQDQVYNAPANNPGTFQLPGA